MKIFNSIEEAFSELGFKPGETIQIMSSQHRREYELENDFIPKTKEEFELLIATASNESLKKMGVRIWSVNEGYLKKDEVHYLFPGEWFQFIPVGFEVIDIFGKKEKFHQKMDDDIRYGCLSFGFVRVEE